MLMLQQASDQSPLQTWPEVLIRRAISTRRRIESWSRPAFRRMIIVCSLSAVFSADLIAADPAKKGSNLVKWEVAPDPPVEAVEWPGTLNFSIPQAVQETALFPSTQSRFCLVGLIAYESDRAELMDLATGKRVGGIQGKPGKAAGRALSPDGKFLAVRVLDQARSNSVEIWSLETGKRISTLTVDGQEVSIKVLDFASSGEVLTHALDKQDGKFIRRVCVWSAQNGSPVRKWNVEHNVGQYDISPGRNLFASLAITEIIVSDLKTGQVKGSISPLLRAQNNEIVSPDEVRFSPDGTEIACLCNGPTASIISVYDLATGALKVSHQMRATQKSILRSQPTNYKGPHLEFVASPPGFLWYGSGLIDREMGLVVWQFRTELEEYNFDRRILTPAGLIASTGDVGHRKLEVLPFASEKLKLSIAAFQEGAEGLVKPGDQIKLAFDLKDVTFGKPDEVKLGLERALRERLAEEGLKLSNDGPIVMTIVYKDTTGKTVRKGPASPKGQAPRPSGEFRIKLVAKDKTTIFEEVIAIDTLLLTFSGGGAAAIDHVQKTLKQKLAEVAFPYFVPANKSLVALPSITYSQIPATESAQDPIKTMLEAKKKKTSK